jgi:hypothetical protein
VLLPDQGGVYYRFTHDGTLERELRVTGSALPLHSLSLDPFRRIFRLIHCEPEWGELRRPAVELAAIGPEPENLSYLRLDDPLPDRALTELAVDVDDSGGFHLLAGTDRRELYYLRPGAAPRVLATGETRWFPIVRAGGVSGGLSRAQVGPLRAAARGRVLPPADGGGGVVVSAARRCIHSSFPRAVAFLSTPPRRPAPLETGPRVPHECRCPARAGAAVGQGPALAGRLLNHSAAAGGTA